MNLLEDRSGIMNMLHKINVKDKFDDPNFKYITGERIVTDF